ncbi:HAD-IC family P-type ATPase [Amycolatopsis sp. K13G38]|uniref:HAD-IC family P-type ATPase n=1 Tax=Amycolatopsis acididurans TaxID=2724524 RepID=A0ABX1JBQ2_9PSEU|nr:HAD-IC family P-type ATPase [Amycolatopsis acididurans]
MTAAQVRDRVERGETNTVARRTSRPLADIVRANVFTRFNAILGALFVVIVIVGPVQDTLFGMVVLANTAIGIVQEWRAKQTLDRLAILGEARPRVWRDGALTDLAPDQLVRDDVIELGPGEQLMVDGTLLSATGLELDESALTGEADPVAKRAEDSILSGSFVVAGAGRYRATHVGAQAYAARLAAEASRFTLAHSELRAGIDRILKWITWLFVPVTAVTLYGQLRGNQTLPDTVRGVVAALVPLVPEGLVLLTSIAFAVGVIRLGRRHCLVQELPAIEGLARVDVVCTDKTGTLTETGMRLGRLHPVGAEDPEATRALAALAAADSSPNASMRAIAAAYPAGPGWAVTASAAFSSVTRWSGASFTGHGNWVLGAPEALLPADSPVLGSANELAARGMRVLLLGRSDRAVDTDRAPGHVEPVALVVLEQKIRPDAASTLDYFAEQDVSVVILSGDNAVSVGAIAAGLHLPASAVFGRVTPQRKQEVVAGFQADGHGVAMTGDGVNDVLALKQADIGVAMGAGSPAARAVAQIVLLDNAFATLPHVVAEGRRVIGNIQRVASLFLIKTVYATVLAVAIGAARLPFPFLPRHLTLIGTLTIGVPAFFLALAPNTERVRGELIRRVLRIAVPVGVVAAAATFGCYFLVHAQGDASLTQQRTAATLTLFLISLAALIAIARPLTWWKLGLVAGIAGAFALVSLVPLGQRFFALDPTNAGAMLTALAIAAVGSALTLVAARTAGQVRAGRETPEPLARSGGSARRGARAGEGSAPHRPG